MSNTSEPQQKIDAHLHEVFSKISLPVLNYVRPTPESHSVEKEKFLRGEIENPTFEYVVPEERLLQAGENLEELKKLLDQESTGPVKSIYEEKVAETDIRLAFLHAIHKADIASFSQASVDWFGKPKQELVDYIFDKAKRTLEEGGKEFNRSDLLKDFLDYPVYRGPLVELENTIPYAELDEEIITSAKEVAGAFEDGLRERGFVDGWQVEIDTTGSRLTFSVVPGIKKVFVPNDEILASRADPLTETKLKGLIAHEIGVHVTRSVNAKQGKLGLLIDGLDRYARGEEGFATYQQQQFTKTGEFGGTNYYLAAAIINGFDRGKERNFRESYQWLYAYFKLLKTEDVAKNLAWSLCLRFFRGSPDTSVHALFYKDLFYLEGNVFIQHLFTHTKPDVEQLLVGKFDPSRVDHVVPLKDLGILKPDFPEPKKLDL